MSPFSEIVFTTGGILLRIVSILLLLAALFAGVFSLPLKRNTGCIVLSRLAVAASFLLFYALADGTYYAEWLPTVRTYWPWIVRAAYAVPWIWILVIELLLGVGMAALIGWVVSGYRRLVSHESIKETMDLLPTGICFGDSKGVMRHANLKMNQDAFAATGKPLRNANALWDELCRIGEEQNGRRLIKTGDGRTLLFTKAVFSMDGETYTEITDANVTDRYRLTAVLQERNRTLKDIQLRMKAWAVDAAEYAMQREILRARVAVHDEVGHALLRGRYALEHPESTDETALLALLKRTNETLLYEAEQPDDAKADPIASALRMANGIGVAVQWSGTPPSAYAALFGQLVRECAANAYKHAEGDTLYIKIETGETETVVSVTNNGQPPQKSIMEAGGLCSLREAVVGAGGTVTVNSTPTFLLTIRLPSGKIVRTEDVQKR